MIEARRERILTTHTGSLPRPVELEPLLNAVENRAEVDSELLGELVQRAIKEAVRAQAEAGIDIVNDGEQGRLTFATYVQHRVSGYGARVPFPGTLDDPDFPELNLEVEDVKSNTHPACDGPLAYLPDEVQADAAALAAAVDGYDFEATFITAVSPGEMAVYLPNRYYPTEDDYLDALVTVMREEYEAIHAAGHIVQLDSPDLALGFDLYFRGMTVPEFRRQIGAHIAALNAATENIPAEAMRMHICNGPVASHHTRDIELRDILDVVLQAKPAGLTFEAANCRHEHDWRLFEGEFSLPEGKYLLPGVIDVTTNRVEHPELVAERIVRLAKLVGRENVVAGTDCGFATRAGSLSNVAPSSVWAKLRSLSEGARLASVELWKR
jgi:5-methyltetrahydropteroyltriglutamate--homocysteine methyltransferase